MSYTTLHDLYMALHKHEKHVLVYFTYDHTTFHTHRRAPQFTSPFDHANGDVLLALTSQEPFRVKHPVLAIDLEARANGSVYEVVFVHGLPLFLISQIGQPLQLTNTAQVMATCEYYPTKARRRLFEYTPAFIHEYAHKQDVDRLLAEFKHL